MARAIRPIVLCENPGPSRRPRRWTFGVACLAAALLGAATAAAQDKLDQSNDPASWGGGAHHIEPPIQSTQTVSPSLPCLTRVEIGLMTGNRGKGGDQVTLKVIDWNPYPPKELASVTASIPEGFDGFWTFTMPGSGITVPSSWVALRVFDTGKNVFWWKYQGGHPYSGGSYFANGAGTDAQAYLFRTYGRPSCSTFSLGVTPDPVNLAQGGTGQATIGVTRPSGFTAPVSVTLALPAGVTAAPASLVIGGASATTALTASAAAPAGSFSATATGTASGLPAVQQSFQVKIAAAAVPPPRITGVAPSVQQRGGAITISGTGFDASCGANSVSFAGLSVVPNACSTTVLSVTVPAQVAYGPTQLAVTSNGRVSAGVAFSVGRQSGSFSEITGDVLQQHTGRTCAGGTAKVDVAASGSSYVATYRRVAGNGAIGSSITFSPDFSYLDSSGVKYTLSNIGGAGFSLCSVALVLDGGNGGTARLFLRDLDSAGDFQASPYAVNIREPRLTAPYTENYQPRFFRSPDGTIILAVTAAAATGTGNVTAAFFDKVAAGAVLKSLAITKPANSTTVGNPAIAVTLGTDNKITLSFGSQTLPAVAIP